jgi:hypothetical protein
MAYAKAGGGIQTGSSVNKSRDFIRKVKQESAFVSALWI